MIHRGTGRSLLIESLLAVASYPSFHFVLVRLREGETTFACVLIERIRNRPVTLRTNRRAVVIAATRVSSLLRRYCSSSHVASLLGVPH